MKYAERTKLRRECSRLIRCFTLAQDADRGRSAYKVPRTVAKKIEDIVDGDSARLMSSNFSEIMQDAGFYRDITGDPRRNPGNWVTGGRTIHGGEPVSKWEPGHRFFPLLRAIVAMYGPDDSVASDSGSEAA
ncbi:hypothetical protein M3P21_08795 [Ruegeria sp. 2012CJ41-6]|uniref:Uncharacterized protein n=1 Tax=Ruegeria spongiae TaxID=2942209 RepID=A0ABT0Q1F3_9RHOB|nr:hypothetical protein [Ruegeria spongiae]MCL6283627.1 hypothetical protein [Ruegeria spongiae]